MKKRILILLILLVFIFTLTACNNAEMRNVSLKVYNYSEMQLNYHFRNFKEPKLINTYIEYKENLFINSISEPQELYSEEYFEKNSVYIIPVLSNKSPSFEIRNFDFTEGILEIEINQNNNLVRTMGDEYSSTYYLCIEISTKNIEYVNFELVEKNDYYKYFNFTVADSSSFELIENHIFIDDYFDYKERFEDTPEYMSIVSQETFIENVVLAYYIPNMYIGNFPMPLDLFYHLYNDQLHLEIQIFGDSGIPESNVSLSILIIRKSDIFDKDTPLIVDIK